MPKRTQTFLSQRIMKMNPPSESRKTDPIKPNLKTAKVTIIMMLPLAMCSALSAESMVRVQYNHPGLIVDLGVGLWAWPMPMDWDEDGDLDLVVSCPDVPFNGTYLFENPGAVARCRSLSRRFDSAAAKGTFESLTWPAGRGC